MGLAWWLAVRCSLRAGRATLVRSVVATLAFALATWVALLLLAIPASGGRVVAR
jgi:hypothetical protein